MENEAKQFECPNCHRVDSVQKVSAIVKSGTSETLLKGNVQGVGGSYAFGANDVSIGGGAFTASASGTQTTVLAKRLPQPNFQPAGRSNGCEWLFWASLAVAVLSLLSLSGGGVLAFLLFGAIAAASFFPMKNEHIRYGKYLDEFYSMARTVAERWNRLYYCHRCDGVFIQGELLSPSDRMLSYLRGYIPYS